ncbi:DUF3237 domain-containing protein [Streptomyces sp. XD-27]|uniref:DUF3237 domain-containing protein n=1 Tax=Streptomyces sp. XD-27 TaxID=3062779 RepID=UPI0026F40C82|nr:DUF3237 domain-containing protein [Streptomyces sp. XD-27]WKX68831.1 DUF3237 domain-containing protein [Streptomyces sp. XD-27]
MTADPRVKDVGDIRTTHLFDMVVDLQTRLPIGSGPFGRRILFGAAGGTFHGPRLHGDVLPGGGDWALFGPDGTMSLDVRLTLRTHDGALLYMTYGGRWVTPPALRDTMADPIQRYRTDPSEYYFRTNPLFETGADSYAWLNDTVCIGSGYLVEGGIAYKVSHVL